MPTDSRDWSVIAAEAFDAVAEANAPAHLKTEAAPLLIFYALMAIAQQISMLPDGR